MPQTTHTPVCPRRKPKPDGQCRHLFPSGCCALPDELTCVESAPRQTPAQKTLPGLPAPQVKSTAPSTKARPVVAADSATGNSSPSPAIDTTRLRGFTTDDIESFKALGVEVCLQSDNFGELWLVPSYTGQARRELTPEHLATVLHALSVFPGSRVTAFYPPVKSEPSARKETP